MDGVDIGARKSRKELARVRGERLHEASLSLGKDDVERERGLARPTRPGHHTHLAVRDRAADLFQVVLARVRYGDGAYRRSGRWWARIARCDFPSSVSNDSQGIAGARVCPG